MKTSDLTTTEYFQYYKQYIDLVGDSSMLVALESGKTTTQQFFKSIPVSKLDFRYAKGKWTPKDILLHLIDTERVFTYRALYFARHENSDLEGFDENVFAQNGAGNDRSIDALLDEYVTLRNATVALFESFTEAQMKQTGNANGNVLSVRACGFIICGHEIHHSNVISERYLT